MKLFSVLKKDLRILLRDRIEMLVLFLMPLAFIIPISLALGSGDGYGVRARDQRILLTVANYDAGPRGQMMMNSIGESLGVEKEITPDLIRTLGFQEEPACIESVAPSEGADPLPPGANPGCVELAGREMLYRSWRTALLLIPSDFSRLVEAGQPAQVTLLYDPAGEAIRIQQVEGVVKGATLKLSLQNQVGSGLNQLTEMSVFAPDSVRESLVAQAATPQPATQRPVVRLEKVPPLNFRETTAPDTYQQTIPGYTVMYVFFIITSMTASIHAEQLNGTFRRLLSMPINRAELLGGKLLASGLIGLAQVLLLFLVGALLFGLRLGNDPLAFVLLTIALVAAAAAMGLAASTTRIRGAALGAPLVVAALIGGCMFPLDLMPGFLRTLSWFVPHSWALTGYQNLMVRGQGLQQVFPQIAVLVGFALLFFFIAIRRFDFERGGSE